MRGPDEIRGGGGRGAQRLGIVGPSLRRAARRARCRALHLLHHDQLLGVAAAPLVGLPRRPPSSSYELLQFQRPRQAYASDSESLLDIDAERNTQEEGPVCPYIPIFLLPGTALPCNHCDSRDTRGSETVSTNMPDWHLTIQLLSVSAAFKHSFKFPLFAKYDTPEKYSLAREFHRMARS